MASENSGVAIVIMGVSGAGKTTIGKLLAETLNCPFLDADDFHSESNKEKMRKGIPLTDDDRAPWLESLSNFLSESISSGNTVILACSALRKTYREILRSADQSHYESENHRISRVKFVLLEVSVEILIERVRRRESEGEHFMPSILLKSQLDLLEIDDSEGVIRVDGNKNAMAIIGDIKHTVGSLLTVEEKGLTSSKH